MVITQIKDVIIGQNMPPGSCIGTERKMCDALNVSRPVLREALSSLKAQGFINATNRGVYVNSITPTAIIEPIQKVLDEDKEKIFELNEVRETLETGMGVLAIDRATKEDIQKVRQALENLERSHRNKEIGHKEDVQFHLRLAESSHNSIYIHILYTVLNLFEKATFLYRSSLSIRPDFTGIIMDQHLKIYNAFIAKDPERLTRAIVDHLTWSANELRRLSEQDE
ncbi:MAG: FadR family transcriptional regulator [Desulfobacteraceae bacterium]|nr:FadR family transcriptional regulator [Desulfobacteraceae bacterium]